MIDKLKLWWIHRVFNWKYPIKSTPAEIWLIKYNEYLKRLNQNKDE